MASGDMSPNTARKLAALIVAGAEQLEEKAQQQGVTAYLGKPVQREKPNERFLQNTLKNLASANRRADERVMWAAWDAQKQLRESRSSPVPQREQSKGNRHDYNNSRADKTADGRERRPDSREIYSRCSRKRQRDGSRGHQGINGSSRRYSSRRSRSRSRSRSHGRYGEAVDKELLKRYRRDAGAGAAAGSDAKVSSSSNISSDLDSPPPAAAAAAAAVEHGIQVGCSSSSTDRGRSDEAEASSDAEASDDDDQQLVQWLTSSKTVKGRGTVGPSADLHGPYLKPPSGLNPDEVQRQEQGSVKGPARPGWLKKDEDASGRLRPDAGFLRGVMRAQGILLPDKPQHGLDNEGRRRRKSHRSSDSDSDSSSSGSEGEKVRHKSSSKKSKKLKKKRRHSSKHKKTKHKKSRHQA